MFTSELLINLFNNNDSKAYVFFDTNYKNKYLKNQLHLKKQLSEF